MTHSDEVSELPSEAEVFRSMYVLLEGVAQIAENHGFTRGDDLMVWLAKALSRRSASNTAGGGVKDAAYVEGVRAMAAKARQHFLSMHLIGKDKIVKAISEVETAFVSTIQAGGDEPVAWQWSDRNGSWYTVDTSRLSLAEQEELCRTVAADNGGVVRPLFTRPATPVSAEVTESLEWENGEARSQAGNLYSVHKHAGNVWSAAWNGTPLTGWWLTEPEAKRAAQLHLASAALATLDRGRG